jgi:hypothetical protein
MSHLSTIDVKLDSLDALKKALEEMGYGYVEGTRTMRTMYGQSTTVELQVKRDNKELPVGFRTTNNSDYELVADWWGLGINSDKFANDVRAYHAKHKLVDTATSKGFKLEDSRWVEHEGKQMLQVTLGSWDGGKTFGTDFGSGW